MTGGDVVWRLAGGVYEVYAEGGITGITGSEAAILRAQQGSERYLQRPDASHVRIDSTRTSLSGAKASVRARKLSGAHWLWNVFFDLETPEVTFNDIGRIGAADGVSTSESLTYRETEPGELFRSYSVSVSQATEWNLGWGKQHTRLGASTNLTWNNFWTTSASANFSFRAQNQRLTRGGPSMEAPQDWRLSLSVGSNPSAQTRWTAGTSYGEDELGGWDGRINGEISMIPAPRWQVSFAPSYERPSHFASVSRT